MPGILDTVKRANRPGPPEHSLVLRVSATGSVVVALAACWSEGELSGPVAVLSIALVLLGNVFSFRTRSRPYPWVKVVLAAAVVVAFIWFIATVRASAAAGDLASVLGPLAVLFAYIQATHAFDVPARRDLVFSLTGSATLMAVAGAQAVSSSFAVYVVLWVAFGLTGLLAVWGSMAGGAPLRVRTVVWAVLAVLVVGLVVVAVLPPPRADSRFIFPSALAGDTVLTSPDSLVGGPNGTEPLHAASPQGRTGVGGFLGFAGPLDTAIRGQLGNQVVMRVRADLPTFWLAETFNLWTGVAWTTTALDPGHGLLYTELTQGPPFSLPNTSGNTLGIGRPDLQTFYLSVTGPNLVFHAPSATTVWFPAHKLYVSPSGTILSGTSLGAGSIYTVQSTVVTPSAAQLRAPAPAGPGTGLSPQELRYYTQLPGRRYPRVHALAERITAGIPAGDTYDKVQALETYLARHTKYTTDIPPLAPGQDTVVQFLFGTRRGYCEQISTSMAVMLRSLGIPVREATGYVPGSYNPLTDLYEVQAKDAHAWVQVWFPGYGWQNFDPTADVPLANPTPASVLTHDLLAAVDRVPAVPTVVILALVVLVAVVWRRRRHAPKTWAAAVTRDLTEAARRAGVPAREGETLTALGARLDALGMGRAPGVTVGPAELAAAATRFAYADADADALPDEAASPPPEQVRRLRRSARQLRRAARRWRQSNRRGPPTTGPPPDPRRTTPRPRATAGAP